MNSRERLLTAYRCDTPDRVPIVFRAILPFEHRWRNQVERAETLLGLGADDLLTLSPPTAHPEITTRSWCEECEPYPLLHKVYETPAGALHTAVQLTPDWQVDDLPLYSDHAWSRGVEPLVKTMDDLAALRYVLGRPRAEQLEEWRRQAAQLRSEADRLGVVLQGAMHPAPLYAMGFLGGGRCLLLVRDDPDLFAAVVRVVAEWSTFGLELLLAAGVDVVYRSSCYETVDFFAPSDVRDLFMPVLAEDIGRCHAAGIPLHSFAQTGVMPFLEDYAVVGLDILSSLDPAGANPMDLRAVKASLGGRCCLMGGVNNREPFLREPPERMEQTVRDTLAVLAPGGGYILSPAGMIFPEGSEENILAFIAAGRRLGRYPLAF